jgi:hypothetical protein
MTAPQTLLLHTGYVTAVITLPPPVPELTSLASELDRMVPGGWRIHPADPGDPELRSDLRITVTDTTALPQVTLTRDGAVHLALNPNALASTTLGYAAYTVAERARQQRGMVTAHAAAALDPAGRAVLLLGDKGAGKTSTLLALLERGYRFLGDDQVVLAAVDPAGGIGVLPGRRRCAVRQVTGRLGYEAKQIVDLDAIPAADVPASGFPVATIIRVSIHPATTPIVTEPAPLSLTEQLRLAENLARYIAGVATPLATTPVVYAPVYPLDDPTTAAARSRLIERIGTLGLRYLHAPTADQAAAAIAALTETPGAAGNPRCA